MRVEHRDRIEALDFPTIRVEITTNEKRDGKRVVGYLKSRLNRLPTDIVLFSSEEELGELLDDLSETLEEVRKDDTE